MASWFLEALLLLTVFFGAPRFAFIPNLVLGGLGIFVGLLLLCDWVYDAWFKFPRADFLIILLILAVIAWKGFLFGVALGIGAAILMFVLSYSQTAVVRQSFSGATYQSRVTRGPELRRALEGLCEQAMILRLQGYIFFGTANSLFETVRQRSM